MIAERFRHKRWVFNPAARRREMKAHRIIAGAHDHLMRTAIITDGIDMDLASFDALQLLDKVSHLVGREADEAQRKARS